MDADEIYRKLIDRLMDCCRTGQGQIASRRARAGVSNANATPQRLPDQHEINRLLSCLTPEQREVLAIILRNEFVAGVHASLAVLYEERVAPFDEAYEGAPFNDFIGRMDNWPWPKSGSRSS